MQFRHYGKTYYLELRSDGLIHCEEMGVKGKTAEEVQHKIRALIKSKVPKQSIKVLTFGNSYWKEHEAIFEGTCTGLEVGGGQYWVTWKDEDGDTTRAKLSRGQFWADTEGNRKIINEIVSLTKQREALKDRVNNLKKQLVSPFPLPGDQE